VRVTEPPSQTVVGPSITGVVGFALTVMLVGAEVALQPFAFVTVTQYSPALVSVIDWEVAPFDQRYEVDSGAVSVTEPPLQNVVGPLGVTTAVAGAARTVTGVGVDVALQKLSSITVTL